MRLEAGKAALGKREMGGGEEQADKCGGSRRQCGTLWRVRRRMQTPLCRGRCQRLQRALGV
jgi:hypothetical protein